MPSEAILIMLIPIGGALTAITAIAFFIGAGQDTKSSGKKASIVKHIYLYLVSFVTLLIITFSVATLLNLGAKATFLPEADGVEYGANVPPGMYLPETKLGSATLDCSENCAFEGDNATAFTEWKSSYVQWQESQDNSTTQNPMALVTAISLLIVAGITYFLHWRMVRKNEQKQTDSPHVTRAIYYWSFSLVGLLAIVISSGFLINTALRAWIYPESYENQSVAVVARPDSLESQGVQSVIDCAEACEFSEADVQLAKQWLLDYDAAYAQVEENARPSRIQNELSVSIPFLLVGLPLFLYHWMRVRKDEDDLSPDASNPSVTS
ncbi:MAG: hypothetical protein H6760_03335 [Candidatus Nomurabacteria bacterium]|nr:MAG: hypothetical protein H6760_03335 [Candidatus Nomurabacteria bacterium]